MILKRHKKFDYRTLVDANVLKVIHKMQILRNNGKVGIRNNPSGPSAAKNRLLVSHGLEVVEEYRNVLERRHPHSEEKRIGLKLTARGAWEVY